MYIDVLYQYCNNEVLYDDDVAFITMTISDDHSLTIFYLGILTSTSTTYVLIQN